VVCVVCGVCAVVVCGVCCLLCVVSGVWWVVSDETDGNVNVNISMNMPAVCSGVVCGVWYV